eukprot:TRINITY_DN10287_c0_g1_i1.p1 TRINITY_DN10287_c0_g1~~TRINITY_DN10287_c0_g1_i1.p1  ORF type:complete len:527 (-),score=136.20 TRINITY_DN10287_c0_g1_i1:14-1594(-)
MGAEDHVRRLLEALAKRLPPSSTKVQVSRALRAAAEALPGSKLKTKAKVLEEEDALVDELLEKLTAAPVEEEPVEEEGEGDDEEALASPEGDAVATRAEACYAGIDSDNPVACLSRFSELLKAALASTRPAEKADLAILGFLAVMPSEATPAEDDDAHPFNLPALQSCIKLIPTAVATQSPSLPRLLGFALTAVARLPDGRKEDEEVEMAVLSGRLGGLVALTAPTPAAARVAARTGLSALTHPVKESVLRRLTPGLLPLVRSAFGSSCLAERKEAMVRGDLVALLHALRLVALSRALQLGDAAGLTEARDLLVTALENVFDATLFCEQLKKVAVRATGKAGKVVRKRLAGSRIKSKAGAAGLVAELFEAVPATAISNNSLRKLADCSGLPVGEDEEIDQKAAAAKAKGELFFEDAEGVAEDSDDDADMASPKVVLGSAVASSAADAIKRQALGDLDGVEMLRSSPKEKAEGKKSKAAAMTSEDDADGEVLEEDADASNKTPDEVQEASAPKAKRRRLSKKGVVAS